MSQIVLKNVSKQYPNGVVALKDVFLNIEEGEWVAVMGPSGSGKSTLLHLIAGLDRPSSGSIIVNNIPVHALSPAESARFRREHIGFIFQQFHLVPYLTALENVMMAQYFHSLPDEEEARAWLVELGLGDRLHHYPHQLSGGEQQRVAIARAVVNDPPIILADEPTGNLDEKSEHHVLQILRSIHKRGKTIILVTHSPRVSRYAQRQIFLEHGRLIERHLETLHQHPVTDEVLETMWKCVEEQISPTLDVLIERAEMISESAIQETMDKGWIQQDENSNTFTFTSSGYERARLLVRRHRLAEYLLESVVGLDSRHAQDTACQFEHILSVEATDAICTFLQHPRKCPHGHEIPPGDCCSVPPN